MPMTRPVSFDGGVSNQCSNSFHVKVLANVALDAIRAFSCWLSTTTSDGRSWEALVRLRECRRWATSSSSGMAEPGCSEL